MCGGLKLMPTVFVNQSPLCLLRQGLPWKPEFADSNWSVHPACPRYHVSLPSHKLELQAEAACTWLKCIHRFWGFKLQTSFV